MELITHQDLKLYKALSKLFLRVHKLERKPEIDPAKVKRVEQKILKFIFQMREDVLNEIGFTRILKPRNNAERVIIDIFGPFSHPPPKDVPPLRVNRIAGIFSELGVDLRHAEPTGRGHWSASIEGTGHKVVLPQIHGRKGEIKGYLFNQMIDDVLEARGLDPGTPEYSDTRTEYRHKFRSALGYR